MNLLQAARSTRLPWRKALVSVCGCVLVSLLAGCATSPPPLASADTATIAPPTYINQFVLAGRLSVRVADRLDSARIEWVRDARSETISFFSPFGSQLAQVSATANGATLTRGELVEYAPSIRALTQSLLGVGIDTDMLARWVQGFDVGDAVAVSSENGEQSAQWSIRAENIRSVDGVVGGRIAARTSATEGDRTIRLFIDSFKPIVNTP